MQVAHGRQNAQRSPYGSLGIIVMGLRIAKVDQQTIPKELGDVPLIASNDLRTGGVIRPYHVPVLFRIELAGESRGVHEVTEHHRELTAFGFRRGRERQWRGGWRCAGRPPGPD